MTADLPKEGDVVVDKYTIERVIAVGGMGQVVAARHLELGQLVAIKFMRPDLAGDAEMVERFLREGRTAASLQSEHVVRVMDFGTTPQGIPFLVMEHLRGQDFAMLIAERGWLKIEEAVGYVIEAADAIAVAHAAGIVHRDLKPENLFLAQRHDGSSVLKVLDFGISKTAVRERARSLTDPRAGMGSPPYAAPEQLRSALDVDARTDQWGLGVTLYELLTGVAPFAAETLPETVTRILEGIPEAPRTLRPEIPEPLQRAVLRCLAKEPDARFGDVAELTAALVPFASTRHREAATRIQQTLVPLRSQASSLDAEMSRTGRATPMAAVRSTGFGRRTPSSEVPEFRPWRRRVLAGSIGALAVVGVLVALRRDRSHGSTPHAPSPVLAAAARTESPRPPPVAPAQAAPTSLVVAAPPSKSSPPRVSPPPAPRRPSPRGAAPRASASAAATSEPSASTAATTTGREAWDRDRFGGRE